MNAPRSFRSPLADPCRRFLAHHRALGKRFDSEESSLFLLDRFLVAREIETAEQITPALLDAFLDSRKRRARSRNHLLGVLQRLFRWLVDQELLPASPLTSRPYRSVQNLRPFLFGPEQVKRILARAAALPDHPKASRRGMTYRMIFALMYGVGLRVGEVSRLCCQDLDTERRCLHVRQTKFLKSRLVPFGPRMADSLQAYLRQRGLAAEPDAPLFSFARRGHRPIQPRSISRTFRQLVSGLDLTVPAGTAQPRLHCLRHSFAVSTLLGWYRSGIDPASRLMHLSVFLGHVNPASTAVYLTVTADLRQLASERFERFAESALNHIQS